MKHLIVLAGWLFFSLSQVPAGFAEETSQAKTLSPYFLILEGDSAVEQFPLKSTDVTVTITGVIAEVQVRQKYANMGSEAIHGRYIFPGSTRAAVHGMKMIIGERVVHAVVQERKQARKKFNEAKKQGKNSALMEQQRPNVFSMDVANIMPGQMIEIELRYSELLIPESGTYEFVYPTVVGPRYSTAPDNAENENERWVANPYLKSGVESKTAFAIRVFLAAGMALQEVGCRSHETTTVYEDKTRARIELARPEIFSGDRDYILRYRLADKQISTGLILQRGAEENFFLLMAQPPERVKPEIIPGREYVFVVDVSGSMHGFPLDTAKILLNDLITSLQPTDHFNVVLFAGGSELLAERSLPASSEHINRAVAMIEKSRGGGGTELLEAMKRALALPKSEGVSRSVVVVTDGYINAERDLFEEIQKNRDQTNVFAFGIGSSVNRFFIEGVTRSGGGEPFIVTTPAEAQTVARRFREYISAPVLTDISVNWGGFDVYDIEPPKVADLFAQRPVIIFGKWRGEPSGSIEISGSNGEGTFQRQFDLETFPSDQKAAGLNYLWARSRLGRIVGDASKRSMVEKKEQIIALGLRYNLLTAFTSFIAVDEKIVNPQGTGNAVKQPLSLPKGVSNMSVGGGMNRVPEPGLVLLVLLIGAVWGLSILTSRIWHGGVHNCRRR